MLRFDSCRVSNRVTTCDIADSLPWLRLQQKYHLANPIPSVFRGLQHPVGALWLEGLLDPLCLHQRHKGNTVGCSPWSLGLFLAKTRQSLDKVTS